jgi:hypothetical protein
LTAGGHDGVQSLTARPNTVRDMDAMPCRPEIFLPADSDRRLVPGGPALVGPDGVQREIPPKVYDAMRFVEAAMLMGYAVEVTPLRVELPIDEAADAIEMDRDELRLYVGRGDIPFRSSKYVDWVKLSDVLALVERLRGQRREALDAMLNESVYDEDDDSPASDQEW